MLNKQEIEALQLSRLTSLQCEHYGSLMWLFDPNPRGLGKSYLLANVFIRLAMENYGTKIPLVDHTFHTNAKNIKNLCWQLIFKMPKPIQERFVLDSQSKWIMYRKS